MISSTLNPIDSPSEFDVMEPDTRELLVKWIAENFAPPTRRQKTEGTSYGLKHDFESDHVHYVSNGQFKGAMLAAGYQPVDETRRNWQFYAIYKRERGKV